MAARVGVERRNAHQAVNARFRLQQPVRVLAIHFEGDRLDARSFALQPIGDDSLETMPLGPSQVHAQQHLRPILAFGAAGAGVDGDDGAERVVLARQQHGGFQAIDVFGVSLDVALDVAGHVFALARQLEHGVEVLGQGANASVVGDGLFQALAPVHYFLAFLGLRPEIRLCDLLFGPAQFDLLRGGVKDTSARPGLGREAARIGVPTLRGSCGFNPILTNTRLCLRCAPVCGRCGSRLLPPRVCGRRRNKAAAISR